MQSNSNNEECSACEVFKNHQGTKFSLGFFCPIKGSFVARDEMACEDILSDNLPF